MAFLCNSWDSPCQVRATFVTKGFWQGPYIARLLTRPRAHFSVKHNLHYYKRFWFQGIPPSVYDRVCTWRGESKSKQCQFEGELIKVGLLQSWATDSWQIASFGPFLGVESQTRKMSWTLCPWLSNDSIIGRKRVYHKLSCVLQKCVFDPHPCGPQTDEYGQRHESMRTSSILLVHGPLDSRSKVTTFSRKPCGN